jgi:carbonic anhydrase
VELSSVSALNDFSPLSFRLGPAQAEALDTGHGIRVSFPGAPLRATLDDTEYALLQFHFHSPAEHVLGPARVDAEAHLVFRSPAGDLAVGAVLLYGNETAPTNRALAAALRGAKLLQSGASGALGLVDPSVLLPPRARRSLLAYDGSLTTPPCSERVAWYVFETPVRVPFRQVLELQRSVGEQVTLALNARPLQALNLRPVRRMLSVS